MSGSVVSGTSFDFLGCRIMLLLMTSHHKITRDLRGRPANKLQTCFLGSWKLRPAVVSKETRIVRRIPGIIGTRSLLVSRLLTLGYLLRALSSELAPIVTISGATTAARNSNCSLNYLIMNSTRLSKYITRLSKYIPHSINSNRQNLKSE